MNTYRVVQGALLGILMATAAVAYAGPTANVTVKNLGGFNS